MMSVYNALDYASRADAATELASESRNRRRLPRKLHIGLTVVCCYALVAIFAPLFTRYGPISQDLSNTLSRPSGDHWLGTDSLGRDVFDRVVYATRIDLRVGVAAPLLAMTIGTTLGALAGYYGAIADGVITRIADAVQALPVYLFVIALVIALGPGELTIIVSFASVAWVLYARLVRTEVLRIKELDYVQAARTGGLSERRVLIRHIMPNAINQAIVYFPIDVLLTVVWLGAFSFLGLGIPPPTAEWGSMIAAGQPYMHTHWWLVTVPGLVIVVLGSGLMLMADGLDDYVRGE